MFKMLGVDQSREYTPASALRRIVDAANRLGRGVAMPINKKPMAQRVFDKAFAPGRTDRSQAYKAGVLQCLRVRLDCEPYKDCPYPIGTADADAYFAGLEAGRALSPTSPLGSAPFGFDS
jgi:hypothetical protein